MTKKQAAVPVKVRRRYRLEDETVVPGVTTVPPFELNVTVILFPSERQWA